MNFLTSCNSSFLAKATLGTSSGRSSSLVFKFSPAISRSLWFAEAIAFAGVELPFLAAGTAAFLTGVLFCIADAF